MTAFYRFRVCHFNKSLGCCKLLYTALNMLCIEAFFDQTSTSLSTIYCVHILKSTMKRIASEFAAVDVSQKWFAQLLHDIQQSDFSTNFHSWIVNCSRTNSTFRFWYFVLDRLLKPILQLYISTRTCNVAARNAALYQFTPVFLATNHQNYSRLLVEHLFDLQSMSPYLFSSITQSCSHPFTKAIL